MLPTFNVITSPRFKSRPARHSGRPGRPGPVHRGRPPYFGDELDAGPADPCLLCGTRRRSGAKSEGRVRVTLKAVGSAFPRKRLWNRAQDEDVMKSFVLSDGWPVNIT